MKRPRKSSAHLPLVLLLLSACACGESDKADVSRPTATPTPSELSALAVDRASPMPARLAAAETLLMVPEGPARLARKMSEAPVDARGLLDSLLVRNRTAGARLAAALMASARGEAKLDYESVLLQQGALAVEPLAGLLSDDRDWQTAVRALDALGKLKAVSALDDVARGLNHPNAWVRMAAAHALGDIGGPEARSLLAVALADTSDTVLASALIALGRTGVPRAVDDCVAFLKHENPRVRAAAVSALGRLGGPIRDSLIPLLDDPDAGVRYKVQRALEGRRETP